MSELKAEEVKTDDSRCVFSVAMPKELLDEVDKAREKEEYNISRTSFVNGLIRKGLRANSDA